MFLLPPNCIVPSATSLTMSPVFPNFLYFISHTPSAANENCDSKSRIGPNSTRVSKRFRAHKQQKTCESYLKARSISSRLSTVKIVALAHFRGITAACDSITDEISVAPPSYPGKRSNEVPSNAGAREADGIGTVVLLING